MCLYKFDGTKVKKTLHNDKQYSQKQTYLSLVLTLIKNSPYILFFKLSFVKGMIIAEKQGKRLCKFSLFPFVHRQGLEPWTP